MSGRHPWSKLFEATFSPEQRAQIIRDADKLVADNRRRPPQPFDDDPQDATSRGPQQPRAASSTR